MMRKPHIFTVIFFIFSLLLAITLTDLSDESVKAQTTPVITPAPIPTIAQDYAGNTLLFPDWSKITFLTLPPIQQSGQVEIPPELVSQLSYDPSRIWTAGMTPDLFVMLGDVADAFNLEAFNLKKISSITGAVLKKLNLDDLDLISWQTASSLVKAIPELGDLQLSQVQPLLDLATQFGGGFSTMNIASWVQQNPELAKIPLGELDLSKYRLQSIPGLTKTPLKEFLGWQGGFIKGVPNLNKVPFSQFPNPLPNQPSAVGWADLPWSEAEYGQDTPADYFISGSDQVGFKVPCEVGKPCSYLEMSDLAGEAGPLYGRRWVSGASQQVKGGYGFLGALNNGMEPTGRLVYGPGFKVVLSDISEPQGIANFSIYFRICVRDLFVDLGCSPYFVGGVPWIPAREKDLVIVSTIPS